MNDRLYTATDDVNTKCSTRPENSSIIAVQPAGALRHRCLVAVHDRDVMTLSGELEHEVQPDVAVAAEHESTHACHGRHVDEALPRDGDDVWFFYEQLFLEEGGTMRRTPWHQDSSYKVRPR